MAERVLLDLELAGARGVDGGDGRVDLVVASLLEGAGARHGGDRSVDLGVALTRELGLLDDAVHGVGGGEAEAVFAGGGWQSGETDNNKAEMRGIRMTGSSATGAER